ncbi:unnamed protein product [Cylicostephanus goldi]|uniref:Uncharacterized protein n=1 Tax=Cylicostephanus goldi TaxID=71465 RepID=A0A3P7MCN7_CYLGO|nr:unnamed protein product [Cylicostephanus goldi]
MLRRKPFRKHGSIRGRQLRLWLNRVSTTRSVLLGR